MTSKVNHEETTSQIEEEGNVVDGGGIIHYCWDN